MSGRDVETVFTINTSNWEQETSEEKSFLLPIESEYKFIQFMSFDEVKEKMEDLTNGDRGVLKRVLKQGYGLAPKMPCIANYKFVSYIEYGDSPIDSSYIRRRNERIVLEQSEDGYSSCIIGLMVALLSMKKSEKSQFILSPEYAYGEIGAMPRIPPNVELFFEIELVDFDYDMACLDNDESTDDPNRIEITIESITKLRKNTNDLLKDRLFNQAESSLIKALETLENFKSKDGKESARITALICEIGIDLAKVLIFNRKCGRACDMCRKVFSYNPKISEAYVLLSQALWSMSQFSSSIFYLRKARMLDKNNQEIDAKLKKYEEELCILNELIPKVAKNNQRNFKNKEFKVHLEFKIQCQEFLKTLQSDQSLIEINHSFFGLQDEEFKYVADYFGDNSYSVKRFGEYPYIYLSFNHFKAAL
ncbi:MAG: Inactive peptidyl-prolyl cis-trans isomerase fkbp6 [Paramarteilia canceri]